MTILASMGPPPFGDGNRAGPAQPARWTGFNGATAFRRWKPEACPCSAEWWLQWGHRLSAMETRLLNRYPAGRRFNGATAFRRWKLYPSFRRRLCSQSRASMGPPPFGDGNTTYPYQRREKHRASMGPPPFGDGNQIACPGECSAEWWLQWGHRLSAMETHLCDRALTESIPASMGPPPFGDGNSDAYTFTITVIALQWGHRLSAMETTETRRYQPPLYRFNGATAFRRWKPPAESPSN